METWNGGLGRWIGKTWGRRGPRNEDTGRTLTADMAEDARKRGDFLLRPARFLLEFAEQHI